MKIHTIGLIILSVFFTTVYMGCQAPEPVKVAQFKFAPKPEDYSPPKVMYPALMSAYADYQGGFRKNQWLGLTSSLPSVYQSFVDEKPMIGTPWYEYLASGKDTCTSIDRLLVKECHDAINRCGVNDVSEALRCLNAGTLAFDLGQLKNAKDYFRKAVWWMEEATDQSTEVKAIIGEGNEKIYKGNFYERAMVHFYLGLIEYYDGNYQDARREFARSIEADKSKPNVTARGKFALAHYWLAKTYLKLNDPSNAQTAMDKTLHSEINIQKDQLLYDNNTTVIVQLGDSPRLELKGSDWESAKYEQVKSPDVDCDIYIDGNRVGSPVLLSDAWTCISSGGRSSLDTLQSGKSVAKNTARFIPFASILTVGWDVKGDARSWTSLPEKTCVWSGNLKPGYHCATIKFYNKDNYELTRYRQTWNYIPVTDGEETVLFVRAMENKCNTELN